LAGSGVRSATVRARRDIDAVAAALTAAGISVTIGRCDERAGDAQADDDAAMPTNEPLAFPLVEQPEPPVNTGEPPMRVAAAPSASLADEARLSLVRHDPTRDEAVFSLGDLTITAQVPWSNETVLRVTIARHDRRCVDRIDLAGPAQRRRFAASAALRLDLPTAAIEHALADLLPAVRRIVEEDTAPTSPLAALMSDAEQAEATTDLRRPDLCGHAQRWLSAIGLTGGEDDQRLLLFLAALSRKTDEPAWLALVTASPAAGLAIDLIAEATPPEEIVAASRLTDQALINTDPGALRHRLLVLHDGERVSPAVGTALRVLHRRGALSGTKVERDPLRGSVRTTVVEARGPVALLTTGTGTIDERLRPCVVEVVADESPRQVEQSLAAERHRRADPRAYAHARTDALRRLRNLQRLIAPRPVLIPFADEIPTPTIAANAERDQSTLMSLITTHALLHQHQRLSDQGAVVATRADLAVANRLAQQWSRGASSHGLGAHAGRLWSAIRAAGIQQVTFDQIEASLLPGWSRHAVRAGLSELVAVNLLSSPRSGRGHRRTYHVVDVRTGPNGHGYDADNRKVCELATVGGAKKPTLSDVRVVG
jgi:hypothetical protein